MLRVFHHYFWGKKLTFFLVESLAICMAGFLGAFALAHALGPAHAAGLPVHPAVYALIALGFGGAFQFALYLLDLYDFRVATLDQREGSRLLQAAGAAAGLVGLAMVLAPFRVPSGALLGGAVGALTGTLTARALFRAVVGEPNRVLILGRGAQAQQLTRMLEREGEDAFEVCAVLDPALLSDGESALERQVQRLGARYVVLATEAPPSGAWADALVRCRLSGIRVYDGEGFSERVLRRIPVAHLRATHLAFADEMTPSVGRRFFKRLFDIAVSLLLLWQAIPTMLLIALAIKLDSKGPVFYRQERVGRNGETYRLWKFRSMRTDAEKNGAVWARLNDDRVTRVGRFIRKTRMDEIPQVFNVLLGDMSFVGPRPERPVFVEQLKAQIPFYGLREAVKPGITGWAQIRYPYGASVEDARNKLEYDLYYVKNGSLFLDLAIIFHTVRHVLLGRGAR